jgi:hypothetical protein
VSVSHVTFLDLISGFFSRVSRSVPFSKKKDPRAGRGSYKYEQSFKFQVSSVPGVFLNRRSRTPRHAVAALLIDRLTRSYARSRCSLLPQENTRATRWAACHGTRTCRYYWPSPGCCSCSRPCRRARCQISSSVDAEHSPCCCRSDPFFQTDVACYTFSSPGFVLAVAVFLKHQKNFERTLVAA